MGPRDLMRRNNSDSGSLRLIHQVSEDRDGYLPACMYGCMYNPWLARGSLLSSSLSERMPSEIDGERDTRGRGAGMQNDILIYLSVGARAPAFLAEACSGSLARACSSRCVSAKNRARTRKSRHESIAARGFRDRHAEDGSRDDS